MRQWSIRDRRVSEDTDCYVIAEVGHNHQGSPDIAREMIRVAKECGVDAVKLQKRSKTQLFTRHVYTAGADSKYATMREYAALRAQRELSLEQYVELRQYANELGLAFIATAFDHESVDFLAKVGVDGLKVASGDIKNPSLLEYMAALKLPMVLSTGGAAESDVQRAVQAVSALHANFCLLQCTSSYPCKAADMNLAVIESYRRRFPECVIGLSSHHLDNYLEVAAFALGARVVEKHYTLSRHLGQGDHAMSLEPAMLKELVDRLRTTRLALGDGVKQELPSEAVGVLRLGKKLVAARALPKGHTVCWEDIAIKGPGDSVPPWRIGELVGRRTVMPHDKDDDLTFESTESHNGG